ncbi:ATP-binding protein [Chondrinema litorale]|uniref:ATP-binding protein n=1 Tax=Chondrinema litorale TaxID=2994555 RepID=UPI0025431783|nr:AAA family ATPase [Chondrinema litorale]UZR99783.1 AAA family ATPase [Chondrinema litorale]
MTKQVFPFSAIVGQEDFKLALILCIIDPTIGGVLALGDKGTGKTTLVRSLSNLLSDDKQQFPFINLPLGASEDRVLGNVDLEKLINDKKQVIQKGLLAQANQGILYIDEINLLNDYLMDTLLDAAATGSYFLEREGISTTFDSRFCLVGTMNPEEGELRPQLKDRFGLSVQISTPQDKEMRKAIIKNRLAFDTNPTTFIAKYQEQEEALKKEIFSAKSALFAVELNDEVISKAADLALDNAVEGMRADILLIKAARAYASFQKRNTVTEADLEKMAPLVLEHRSNKKPSGQQKNQNQSPEKKKIVMNQFLKT